MTQVNGGARDPSIVRGRDSKTVWVIATDRHVYANGGVCYTVNGSTPIVRCLQQISPSNPGMTWASDAIWDPAAGKFMMTWTCNPNNGGWHIVRSYTKDFRTFTTAEKILSDTGMDVTIWRNVSTGAYYHRAKNGPNELIEQTKASSLYTNSWMVVKNQLASGTLPKGEGPLLFPDNIYSVIHLWVNDYTIGREYAPFDTVNVAAVAWEPAPSWHSMPKNARNGYVIGIRVAIVSKSLTILK